MKMDPRDFRVPGGEKIKLKKWATDIRPLYKSGKHYKELLTADVRDLRALQRLLYASNGYSVLLIFQAMDAAGKDGAISHVLSGVNPQGCEVYSFKHPSAEELEHDFYLAHDVPSAGARTDRCLQPLLLRGGADCPRASRDFAQ
jgi:polyphosphate kinase 2 (PPK2 family)